VPLLSMIRSHSTVPTEEPKASIPFWDTQGKVFLNRCTFEQSYYTLNDCKKRPEAVLHGARRIILPIDVIRQRVRHNLYFRPCYTALDVERSR